MSAAALLSAAIARIAANTRRLPASTYRFQFHGKFTFRDAIAVVPYLARLGITHAYASPYFRAQAGSTHGYDVIDPCMLNPEIGTRADFDAFIAALHANNIGQILDVVPNHVGVATNDNTWWNDVLENGRTSRFANYFDIAWRDSPRPELYDKVLLPLLGSPYADVLEKGELKLVLDGQGLAVKYDDRRLPIAPDTYAAVLRPAARSLAGDAGRQLQAIVADADALHHVDHDRHETAASVKHRLLEQAKQPNVRDAIERSLARLNGSPGDARSFDALDALLVRQHFRLAYWRAARDEINYRRFFDVNDLAALAMERQDVFDATQPLILELLTSGAVDGLRCDHPDGLYDPKQYFQRLQAAFVLATARHIFDEDEQYRGQDWGAAERELRRQIAAHMPQLGDGPMPQPLYVVGEKILAVGEPLPSDWPVAGTSGYDFLNAVNGLFINASAKDRFTQIYTEFGRDSSGFAEVVYEKKNLILDRSLASELEMLTQQLAAVTRLDRHWRDFTRRDLRRVLRETIACFAVYRTYGSDEGMPPADVPRIESAIGKAIERNPAIERAAFDFLRDVLLLRTPSAFDDAGRAAVRNFAGKFQQVTSPVTAKGIEDTAFYCYNRFVSLNEVGGDPERFGNSPADLHAYFADRAANWPYSMSTLSTHDTKRSEDVRARLNILSELPDEWAEHCRRWYATNTAARGSDADAIAPDEEYLLYQTLAGVWPQNGLGKDFIERVQAYMLKAMREAKLRTGWTDQNKPHEDAVRQFVADILDEAKGNAFLADFLPFQQKIARLGVTNSLAQTLLRIAAPGVPDSYQGTELLDLSLVDPDNRRPVDYARRATIADAVDPAISRTDAVARLADRPDELKWLVTAAALRCRRKQPTLFSEGEYLPLKLTGSAAGHAFAFARRHGDQLAVVVVPRLVAKLTSDAAVVPSIAWDDTLVRLDGVEATTLRNVFTGERAHPSLRLGDLLKHLSVAMLLADG